MNAIEVAKLYKSYGKVEVLNGIDLTVESGSLLALLGPNGAGKTTTVRILATLLRFNSGQARIFGHDVITEPDAVRQRVSLTGQFASLDEDITGRENLILVGRLNGYSWQEAGQRADEMLATFDLAEAADRQVKKYSGGMQRRLDIAASIVVAPDLLFLDEPTTGLDPRSRRQIWDLIRGLQAGGTTVLLTTQYLEEADALADRIVILDRGTIIADGTPSALKGSLSSGRLDLRLKRASDRDRAAKKAAELLGVAIPADADPARLLIPSPHPEAAAQLLAALTRDQIAVAEFSLGQPTLDEVFLALTNDHANAN
jgi:ABC-2 type transport system ATP-binding protein